MSIAEIYRERFALIFSRLVVSDLTILDAPGGVDADHRRALLELREERRVRLDRILEHVDAEVPPALRDTVTRLVLTADLIAAASAGARCVRDREIALEETGAALLADL